MSNLLDSSWLRDGTWLRLVFHHPKGNIITADLVAALSAALVPLRDRSHLRLVTLEGAGDTFSYGASVEEHLPGAIERVLPQWDRLILDLLAVPAPTAAVVRGRCLGGGFELALACDFIFAADNAVLGLPEVELGVFPPAGAALLPMRVGAARATQAIVTGEARPAAEWRDAGVVTLVVPAARLQEEVAAWFDRHLAHKAAVALRHASAAARLALRRHVERCLPELERAYLNELMRTRDAVEGIRAFLERRKPVWTDG